LQRTFRYHRDGILAALDSGSTTAMPRDSTDGVRVLTSHAFGFRSAGAVAAMIMLCCGPVQLRLPHDNDHITDRFLGAGARYL
jgi:hypothetical protein